MKRSLKWLGWTLGTLAVLLLLATLGIYTRSEMILNRTYSAPPVTLTSEVDAALLARGEHLVNHVSVCVDCHGPDLAGGIVVDDPALGRIVAPNLTTGVGGIGAQRSDEEFARAVRYGILPTGKSVQVMPADDYNGLSDADLAAVIAYVRAAPPQDQEWPTKRIGLLGRLLLTLGQLPIMIADRIDLNNQPPTVVKAELSLDYGRYLAKIGGCAGCHGLGLSGGPIPGAPPEWPLAANLTTSGDVGKWREADFITTIRTGVNPAGKVLDNTMPWFRYSGMSDSELQSLWRFIQSVPAKPAGSR